MNISVFIFTVGLLAYVRPAPTGSELVWLKDVTTRFQSDKRTLSDIDLADELTFYLRRGSGALTLNLKRNHEINPHADVYFVRQLKDGRSFLAKQQNLEKEAVGYYQDRGNGAYMTVKCVERSNKQCDIVINGNIRIGDSSYDLRPVETDDTSRNMLEVPGLLGKRYVLQDQANIQREHLVENKDAANVNETKVNQELIALLRRFRGQHKQNHFPRSEATLSSGNVADLHNRGATDTTRDLMKTYYVEVAVLIDSGMWDLYSSTVRHSSPLIHRSLVKKKIREAFSHIMNGVNLRYKEIEDPNISIHVTLCEFIFFQRQGLFPHKLSNVSIVNEKKYIELLPYILDLFYWEFESEWNHTTKYDHAMLFTSYDLYSGDRSNNAVDGCSYNGCVCEPGSRSSLIQATDYARTVLTAAHELAHNLGADHDGDGHAKNCSADDYFIMSPNTREVGKDVEYSRNPWVFSNCTVETFKKTLKDKHCLTNMGVVYNVTEWMGYMGKQPGEVYDPNEQCSHINGRKSRYCGTVPADICNLMTCTNPKTGKCIPNYYGAARGTKCGEHMGQAAACHAQSCMKSDMLQDFGVQSSIIGYENCLSIFVPDYSYQNKFMN